MTNRGVTFLCSLFATNKFHNTVLLLRRNTLIPTLAKAFGINSNMNISYEELNELLISKPDSALLIDVREPQELHETGVLPKSINIPLNTLSDEFQKLSAVEFKTRHNREKPKFEDLIIFSCRMGGRSAKAHEIATKMGYTNLRNFSGGWEEWAKNLKTQST